MHRRSQLPQYVPEFDLDEDDVPRVEPSPAQHSNGVMPPLYPVPHEPMRRQNRDGDPLVMARILGDLLKELRPIAEAARVPLPGLTDGPDAYFAFLDTLPWWRRRPALAAFHRAEARLLPHYEALRQRGRGGGR
jgi:hypothetical protein